MSDIDDLFNELEAVQSDSELLEDPTYADMLKEAEDVRAQEEPRPLPPAPPVVILPPKMVEPPKPSPALVSDLPEPPPSSLSAATSSATFSNLIDIEKFVDSFEKDYQAISTDLVRDRAKVDQATNILFGRVETGVADKSETETLAKLLDTMVNSNGHRVKLLESKAKFLAATKSTVTTLIQNNIDNGNGDDDESLVDLLSQNEEFEA